MYERYMKNGNYGLVGPIYEESYWREFFLTMNNNGERLNTLIIRIIMKHTSLFYVLLNL